MPLAIVANVAYDADAARVKGEIKRPTANPRPRRPTSSPAYGRQELDVAMSADDEFGGVSTAGLAILAQALAAYSQN
jgi:hypothetical protein